MGRKHKAPQNPIFFAVDSWGIPLEIAIGTAERKGWTTDACLFDFLLGAVKAGWTQKKARGEIKELRLFLSLPDKWIVWADGGFDTTARETEAPSQSEADYPQAQNQARADEGEA